MKAAGTVSQTGPNLDEFLTQDDAAGIREMIVSPGKEIAKGYGANIMPPNYGQTLSPQELAALVTYIDKSVHGGKQ